MSARNIAALACLVLLAACTRQQSTSAADSAASRTLERAGQPIDPLKTAGHITAARLSALAGDQDGIRHNVEAMSEDVRRAMKLPDAARPIAPEAARAAARSVPGVRSVAWIDRSNLLVRVEGMAYRTHQVIDEVCYQLQPLGDTLAVVVHLQNAAPTRYDEMDALSRNCQLAPGDRAMLQQDRRVNTLDPAIREQHRANVERMRAAEPREMSAGDRTALEAIPEM